MNDEPTKFIGDSHTKSTIQEGMDGWRDGWMEGGRGGLAWMGCSLSLISTIFALVFIIFDNGTGRLDGQLALFNFLTIDGIDGGGLRGLVFKGDKAKALGPAIASTASHASSNRLEIGKQLGELFIAKGKGQVGDIQHSLAVSLIAELATFVATLILVGNRHSQDTAIHVMLLHGLQGSALLTFFFKVNKAKALGRARLALGNVG
mmetsp:Transcript_144778/g.204832  ORF Transcript_144778/g.204832 Transcript_144778/m.204832 type:complete len:205 (+) Transcript_144778:226-840(+)